MEETVEHVSKGFLGLTMNCARCHDHKFDPIEQADFYRLRAFFEPYQVRMDVVPGESDLARDGIPRAFDSAVDPPTYRYIRGDEKNPDKSKIIAPGVPAVLAFAEPDIKPVSLPDEAWQPERRPWVLDAYLAAGRKRVEVAKSEFQQTEAKLAEARHSAAKIAAATSSRLWSDGHHGTIHDVGYGPLEALWRRWAHEPGRLDQKQDGPTRSALRLLGKPPQDFDASVRFTILGGSQYRSVGLSFDASQEDPTGLSTATDSEQKVYVSAWRAAPRSRPPSNVAARGNIPAVAVRTMPVELNRPYTLRVQVRGSLVNASLDGEPMIAWETSLPRRDGAMQLITFDALAVFHDVTIRVLDPAVPLRVPDVAPAVASGQPLSVEMAQAAVAEAEQQRNVAEAALGWARPSWKASSDAPRPNAPPGARPLPMASPSTRWPPCEPSVAPLSPRHDTAGRSPSKHCIVRRATNGKPPKKPSPKRARRWKKRLPKPRARSNRRLPTRARRRGVDADPVSQLGQGRSAGRVRTPKHGQENRFGRLDHGSP